MLKSLFFFFLCKQCVRYHNNNNNNNKNNNNDSTSQNRLPQRTDYVGQPYFKENFSREDAIAMLTGKPAGSFVLRPSTFAGCLAITHVEEDGSLGHVRIFLSFFLSFFLSLSLSCGSIFIVLQMLPNIHSQFNVSQSKIMIQKILGCDSYAFWRRRALWLQLGELETHI